MIEQYSNILVEFYEKMSGWENSIVAGRGISLPQMHLLEVVGNHSRLRMKELSARLGVTSGTLTVMVNRLEKNGYVIKRKDPEDGRSFFIELTGNGLIEYDNHHKKHMELVDSIVKTAGVNASEVFFKSLEKIQSQIREQDEQ